MLSVHAVIIKQYLVAGFDIDELGDETSTVEGFQIIHVPIYAEYTECGLCGFTYNDFIEIE